MPVKDRVIELRMRSSKAKSTINKIKPVKDRSIVAVQYVPAGDDIIQDFLEDVRNIQENFDVLEDEINEVCLLQSSMLEFNEMNNVSQLQFLYDNIKQNSKGILKNVKGLENQFKGHKFHGTETEHAICIMQHMTLQKKLTDCLIRYYNIQEDYKSKCKARIKRQTVIAGVDMNQEDFNEVVGEKTEVFLKSVLPNINISHELITEVKARHEQFLAIEKSLQKLHDMLYEIQVIIEAEKETLNRIDQCVHVAKEEVGHAKLDVANAKKNLCKSHQKLCIIGALVSIVLIIILLSLTGSFHPSSNSRRVVDPDNFH